MGAVVALVVVVVAGTVFLTRVLGLVSWSSPNSSSRSSSSSSSSRSSSSSSHSCSSGSRSSSSSCGPAFCRAGQGPLEMFEHIKDFVEADDSGPRAWKLLRDVIQPNTLPMVIVLEKELAAISMRPGDDVKPVLDKIKDTYARMAAAGSSVSQLQQCTKIISVLDNSWDNFIPTLNSQQDQWTPEWLRQQILQEDFRRRHVGGGAATKTADGENVDTR
ncbi:hypothetical protein CLOM_g16158 [Closterium sp. NIES-68]|nr:hypothetical protein CLOM_g16158 [Closterium sp. NIES-68]